MGVIVMLVIALAMWIGNLCVAGVQHKQQEQTCDQACWQQKMCTQPKYQDLSECQEPLP